MKDTIDIWKEYGEDVVACGKHHCFRVDYSIDDLDHMVNIVFYYSDEPASSTTFRQITPEEIAEDLASDQKNINILMKMRMIKEARRVGCEIADIHKKHEIKE